MWQIYFADTLLAMRALITVQTDPFLPIIILLLHQHAEEIVVEYDQILLNDEIEFYNIALSCRQLELPNDVRSWIRERIASARAT